MKIKVYLTSLEGVGSIPKDNIVCEYESNSFDLRIQGLNGKNYRLKVPELQNEVSVADCKHQVKSNSITVTLQKAKDEWWSDLKPKKTLLEKKPQAEKQKMKESGDPMGGLMDMMKEMYQNGDENTRRMIAESWTKAQQEKQGKIPKSASTAINEAMREMP